MSPQVWRSILGASFRAERELADARGPQRVQIARALTAQVRGLLARVDTAEAAILADVLETIGSALPEAL